MRSYIGNYSLADLAKIPNTGEDTWLSAERLMDPDAGVGTPPTQAASRPSFDSRTSGRSPGAGGWTGCAGPRGALKCRKGEGPTIAPRRFELTYRTYMSQYVLDHFGWALDMYTYGMAWFLEGVPEPIIDQRILSHLHNYQRECADTNETYVIHYTGERLPSVDWLIRP